MSRFVLLMLLVGACRCGGSSQVGPMEPGPNDEAEAVHGEVGDPALPGIEAVDAELAAALQSALGAKGEGYEARAEHRNAAGQPRYTNRLIRETSPYLLQHAHNPVNWFPWGEEAFEKARREDKPIFLSVGYSTCHWCHVMERESFEDEEIAAYINAHYVPIKVDREERPDIDSIYMTAVHLMNRRGGWPMTVLLTPDADPFFGGTYIPARDGDRGSRMGLLTLLRQRFEAYRSNPGQTVAEAQAISQRVQEMTAPPLPAGVPERSVGLHAAAGLLRRFDPREGGFGRAPKFPQPSRTAFLLRHAQASGDAQAARAVRFTLEKMAAGGIYDQLGGGFHRYATDGRWLVPHFEKMLYDNAQLVSLYLEGYRHFGDENFARIATETLDYVRREMRSEDGVFYSATDADSPGPSGEREEGLFFLWRSEEFDALLGDDAELARRWWGVSAGGNFEGQNILTGGRSIAALGDGAAGRLEQARRVLYEARAQRPPPLRDDKILTSWNGMMISAFAQGAWILNRPEYLQIAETAARRILAFHRDDEGRLLRSSLGQERGGRAFLQDHAALALALLDLVSAGGDDAFLEQAIALMDQAASLFGDAAHGGYFGTAHDAPALLVRDKPHDDGAVPSGNALALEALVRLEALTGEERFRQAAGRLLATFATPLRRRGLGMTRMLAGLQAFHGPTHEIVIVEAQAGSGEGLLQELRRRFLPNTVLLRRTQEQAEASDLAVLRAKTVLQGQATAFVCERGRCQVPTSEPAIFAAQLESIARIP